jgi:hypothetical protein
MLRYAADLNGKIAGLSVRDFENKTRFFVKTEIVPVMDELRSAIDNPARPWHRRAIDTVRVLPSLGAAYFAGGTSAVVTKILMASAGQFFTELGAAGDKQEILKRTGLYYLLRLQAFQADRGTCQ